jgi:hypothetical protein
MALSEKRKQAKQRRKLAKRKKAIAVKSSPNSISARALAARYSRFPVREAVATKTLEDQGIGNLFLSRVAPDGSIGVAVILLDVYCLGVKDAFFTVFDSEADYEAFKSERIRRQPDTDLDGYHPSCMRKLVEGAIGYARELGFEPHPDYKKAAPMLGDIESAACPQRFEYGKDGMPFYISGPSDSRSRVRHILAQLEKRCGEGKYRFLCTS